MLKFKDCSQFRDPGPSSRLRQVRVTSDRSIDVECDDARTVVQKRFDGTERFDRNWTDYQQGFGQTSGKDQCYKQFTLVNYNYREVIT